MLPEQAFESDPGGSEAPPKSVCLHIPIAFNKPLSLPSCEPPAALRCLPPLPSLDSLDVLVTHPC